MEKLIVQRFEGYCLVISSLSFLISGAYAFFNGIYWLGWLSVITTLVSMNYWRRPIEGVRRKLDLHTAKISFAVFFITGVVSIRDINILKIGYTNAIAMLSFYFTSNYLHSKGSSVWIIFHMLFHISVALVKPL